VDAAVSASNFIRAAAMSAAAQTEPWEFAHVVRFLVSPLAGFITGEIIDINDGLLMD
jgi:NAD(P)-dependent dehydrogenase (short-subunit alcohol dehydrogenase family)